MYFVLYVNFVKVGYEWRVNGMFCGKLILFFKFRCVGVL